MTTQEVKDFILKSYKRVQGAEVIRADEEQITIVDKYAIGVPYKWVAHKLMKKYNVECVLFKVGSPDGNGWFFYKSLMNNSLTK